MSINYLSQLRYKMKKITITKNSKIYLYKKDNSILIITTGIESPFYYDDLLKEAIMDNINISSSKTIIYLDMLSCVGSNSQRFLKIDFSNKYKVFDTLSLENVEFLKMPRNFRNIINDFYSSNSLYVSDNNILSQNEKRELLQAV